MFPAFTNSLFVLSKSSSNALNSRLAPELLPRSFSDHYPISCLPSSSLAPTPFLCMPNRILKHLQLPDFIFYIISGAVKLILPLCESIQSLAIEIVRPSICQEQIFLFLVFRVRASSSNIPRPNGTPNFRLYTLLG